MILENKPRLMDFKIDYNKYGYELTCGKSIVRSFGISLTFVDIRNIFYTIFKSRRCIETKYELEFTEDAKNNLGELKVSVLESIINTQKIMYKNYWIKFFLYLISKYKLEIKNIKLMNCHMLKPNNLGSSLKKSVIILNKL